MTQRRLMQGAAFAMLLAMSACVPSAAGYSDVLGMVKERTGREAHWNHQDGQGYPDEVTRRILAKPLTAERAVQVALLNNPKMQAAFEELGIARGRLVAALAIPNPVVDGGLGFTSEGTSPDVEFGVHESITDLLFLGPKQSVADAELEEATLTTAGKAIDLAYQARTSFYRFQADQQILELRRSVLRAANASFVVATKLHEAGNIVDLEFLSEKALYEESRINLSRAETAFQVSRQMLNATLGLHGKDAQWKTAGRLDDPQQDDPNTAGLEGLALERSIDLDAISKGYTAAARLANLATVQGFVPGLSVGIETDREDGIWEVGPRVELQLPLFYQGQGQTAEAEAKMRRQKHLYAATALQIRASSRAAAIQLRDTRSRATYFKEVLLPLRTRVTEETLLMYNAMSIGPAQVLMAKRDQIETGRMYVEALRDYWLARAAVRQLLAGRLPDMMSADGMGTGESITPSGGGGE